MEIRKKRVREIGEPIHFLIICHIFNIINRDKTITAATTKTSKRTLKTH